MNNQNKILYIDILKRNIDSIVSEPVSSQQKINIDIKLKNNLISLIKKIFKKDKVKNADKLHNDIYSLMINHLSNPLTITMYEINKIINKYQFPKLVSKENINHKWVANNLVCILNYFGYNSDISIVDIGGGQGDILKYISSKFNIPTKNLYCIESQSEWAEKYNFPDDINYILWDNQNIDILPNSIDVIFIIVALHHMNDQTINNLLSNITKMLKSDGVLIIKEHDCQNNNDKIIIDWEHHFYHILNSSSEDLSLNKLKIYEKGFIDNYKSKDYLERLFDKYDFEILATLDRKFFIWEEHSVNNPTNLYWQVLKKKQIVIEEVLNINK